MKKLFNYALLAAALLIGVNVNAVNVAKVAIEGGTTTEYATLADAFGGIGVGETATITMLDNAEISAELVVPEQAVITWNLAEKVVTISHQVKIIHTSLSIEGKGQITGPGWADKYRMFYLEGSATDNCGVYTYFKVGSDVSIECTDGYVMAINSSADPKHAFGLQIDIAGYLYAHAGPVNTPKGYTFAVVTINGGITDKTGTNLPEIWLRSTGTFLGDGMGIYGAGYAIWHIYGRCEGALGIYIKSGEWDIDGATIVANATSHDEVTTNNSGTSGGDGTGIVIDSHEGYGKIGDINIANSTVISNATGGYAIEEVATQGGTKLPNIVVESGTFVGGITTTTDEQQAIIDRGSINGGEWHNTDINQYLDNKHTTIVYTDKDGKHYQVVVPIGADDWKQSIAVAAGQEEGAKYAKVAEDETVSSNTTVEFVRIEAGTTVTVANGATLDAGTLMTEGNSQVIVEAGGTLIVSGDQGAYTFDEKSIIIKTNTEDYGQLLINPAVALNTTPKATVRFNSDAFRDANTGDHAQLFGNPMVSVDEISAYQVKDDEPATSAIYFDLWKNSQWNHIGGFNVGQDLDKTKLEPFGLCCITSRNDKDNLLYYVMEGSLVGNSQPQNFSLNYGWTSAANSWTGDMGGRALIDALDALVDGGAQGVSVNAYIPTIEGNTITWNAYGMSALEDGEFHVEPMQPMMFDNEEAKIIPTDIMSYENLVWNSRPNAPKKQAPRHATSDIEKANIRITSAEGISDRVVVAETEQYSDPRYSARKYMNDEICVYVNADKNYDVYMVENVENTYVGFNCKNAGKYTVSFEKVSGNFALLDLKTNARIEMSEGNTYEFLAEAGDDAYRFMIVEAAKAPTNTPATKAAVKATKALINDQIVINNGERFFNMLGTDVK